jgi:hypothetical protein
MKPVKNIPKFMQSIRLEAGAGLDERIHADIDRALAETQQTLKVPTEPNIRRTLMRSPILKLAIAAVVVVAAVVVIPPMLGGKPAFAKVIQPILSARTVAFDFVLGEDSASPVMHDIVVGNRIRRTISNMPIIMVLDLDSGKMLTLDPRTKGAATLDIQGHVTQGTQNILALVRDIVQNIADHPQDVQDLGERQIDGRKAVGYLIQNPNEKLQIWADLKKAIPVRIELHGNQSVVVLRSIDFDSPADESLVSMDVPAGYAAQATDLKMGDFTEEDLLTGLRAWAQVLNDGTFPDTISAAAVMQQLPALQEKLGKLTAPAEEKVKLGMGYGKTAGFLTMLDYQGEWRYAGQGVTFGDAKKAVFWYRRGKAGPYRVIYGDLHVEDVEPDRLPK